MLRKNTKTDRVWVDQGTEFGGDFEKFCKSKDIINIYSTNSETKSAVAERAFRSLKNIVYRCMAENCDNYDKKMAITKWVLLTLWTQELADL